MKAIAYSIKPQEKESLAVANNKKHDLTLISNELNAMTAAYAQGKEVIIISVCDLLDESILRELKHVGVKKIITRSETTTHIDLKAAARIGLNVANTPQKDQSIKSIAEQTIRNLDLWEKGKCVGNACCCQNICTTAPQEKRSAERKNSVEHRNENSHEGK